MGKFILRLSIILALTSVFTIYVVTPLKSPPKNPLQDTWTVQDSKSYAYDRLGVWRDKQMSCLSKLWGKESAWNPNAHNKIKVMGKHAGGIPQLLGLDPATPPTEQIDRGLSYIYYRYGTPCLAWAHFKKKGWH
jgi:hypothetical protein